MLDFTPVFCVTLLFIEVKHQDATPGHKTKTRTMQRVYPDHVRLRKARHCLRRQTTSMLREMRNQRLVYAQGS